MSTLPKKHAWPADHWNWPVTLNHSHGVRCGNYAFTGGQASLDRDGNLLYQNNLDQQCNTVIGYLDNVLLELGCTKKDLVRVVVYFVGDHSAERSILNAISNWLDGQCRPVINTILLPALCYPDMLLEVEGVAMRHSNGDYLPRKETIHPELPCLAHGFSHIVQCEDSIFLSDLSSLTASGEVQYPDDIIAQTTVMMDALQTALRSIGASLNDVSKLNVFYIGDGTAENWEVPARIRADCFENPGPAATGITVPSMAIEGLMTKLAVTAMRNSDGTITKKSFSWPQGHWNWTTSLPYQHGNQSNGLIHLGGQVALDSHANVLHRGDIVKQTEIALENIVSVLAEINATLKDVVKVTTFYVGTASAEALHKNLQIRSATFGYPGPATSGIPVPCLVYPDMLIEIEVIAVVDFQS